MSVNKVIVLGRIGKIEQKFMTNGKAVVNFSVATSESWTGQQGQKQEKTEWINCVAFDKKAEVIFQYFQKGSEIYVEGKFTTRKWQDQSGQDRWTTEVQVREFSFTGGSRVGDQANKQNGEYGHNHTGNQQVFSADNSSQQQPQQNLDQAIFDSEFEGDMPF